MHTPTPSQLEAILAADEHVLVAAGAGTGKTSTVVSRILYLLGVEIAGHTYPTPLQLRDIGAITYTNAAAADLKRKLRDALRESGRRELAHEVDGARIGTIHGFCGDVLREFALRSRRNPRLRVLEEAEGAALAGEAVHDAVLQALEDRSVPGLDDLFAAWSVADVEIWLGRLVGESARLDRIASERAALGAVEQRVLDLAILARAELQRRLDEMGAVDFDRMIVWTRDLLRKDELVRRLLQRRLRALIVDEFQDVDPVQREIAYLLGEPESRRATTRLMLVGDPKQSIYRFRRADVTVWKQVQEDFEGRKLGRVVALADNFRSLEPILAFVGATVGSILDRPLGDGPPRDYEVPFRPVAATRFAPDDEPTVELLFVTADDGVKPKADEIRMASAEAIARRATELNRSGVRWREMAVLLPGWGSLEIYESALRVAAIPTYALRGEGFLERREVLDLILALETLRDPRDDRALLGFLRSPFVGLKDETLLAIARESDQPYWDYLHLVEVGEQSLLDAAVALLRDHVALRDRVPTDRLLESLLDRSGYLAHLYALADADQAIANVRKFLRLARQTPEQNVGDLLRALREIRERGERVGDARLYGEGEDVLTITSVHSAKGLEWRVVFWADLLRKPMGVSDNLLVGRDRIALKEPDLEAEEQPIQWQSLQQEEEAEEQAERKRLWYVAATRAKDRLILPGLTLGKLDQHSPGRAILEELGEVPAEHGARFEYTGQGGKTFAAVVRTVRLVARPEDAEATEVGAASDIPPFSPRPLPALTPALAAPPGRARHSATELMAYARCGQRHWFRYVAGIAEPPVDRTGTDFTNAIARGQIVHDVLEHLDAEADMERLLEVAIGRWEPDAPVPETGAGRRYRVGLRQEVESAAGHPSYRSLADNRSARRELRFMHILGPDAYTEGAIDLAAREADGLAALDIKTGAGDADSARRKARNYALQRDVYVAALGAIGAVPVSRFGFQFSGAHVHVPEPMTPASCEEAKARVGEVLRVLQTGGKRLTEHPAECRHCGYRGIGWCEGVAESGGEC